MVRDVAATRIGSGSLDQVRYELRTGGLRVRRLPGRPPFGPGTDADVVSRREIAVSGRPCRGRHLRTSLTLLPRRVIAWMRPARSQRRVEVNGRPAPLAISV
jgi:hypothetical protein